MLHQQLACVSVLHYQMAILQLNLKINQGEIHHRRFQQTVVSIDQP